MVFSIVWIGVVITLMLNSSRSHGLIHFYSAPQSSYLYLDYFFKEGDIRKTKGEVTICSGKEWYRFPSSYFLEPYIRDFNWDRPRAGFFKDSFHGLLPQPFGEYPGGLKTPIGKFNNYNTEELSAYTDLSACTFIVDFDADDNNFQYLLKKGYKTVYCKLFLNADKSKSLLRSFYGLEYFVPEYYHYSRYCVLSKLE